MVAGHGRRIKISAVFHVCSRRDSRSHPAGHVIRRNTNCRHINGDHHGRVADNAAVLLAAPDEIVGMHSDRSAERGLRPLAAPSGVPDRGNGDD
jgi:hypothetical protein